MSAPELAPAAPRDSGAVLESAALAAPVSTLPGIGPARARALERIQIRSVRDLVCLVPLRASTAAAELPIARAVERAGEEVTVRGRVERLTLQRFGRRSTLRVVLTDATGSLPALFFNQPWMRKQFEVGAEVVLRGRIGGTRGAGSGAALLGPRIGTEERPLAEAGSVTLAYPGAEGISPETLARLARSSADALGAELVDPIPRAHLERLDLPELAHAVRAIHAPASLSEFERARRRLALEPLLALQARLQMRRQSRAGGRALAAEIDPETRRRLRASFAFEFTAGQRAIADELDLDLARTVPMRRLLQGDVGSGKTALGVYAALIATEAGGQVAFLAPTELLAEQHYHGLRELFANASRRVLLLTGSLAGSERRAASRALAAGDAHVVFGTHALFSEDVRYRRLAMCVIDEQQRFGVAQRSRLIEKGEDAHVLLMTATPIPRTLALTLYGDLDTSVLRERPPGRGIVRTRWVRGQDRRRVPVFLRERLEAGEQVYWVAPRIGTAPGEEGDDLDVARSEESSAERAFARLGDTELARFGIELVHGRLDPDERAERLARFRSGAARVLVATTVIEVGVDVPSATVMVIENAERLGLSQLHQLRGRIGRGAQDGWCLLFGKPAAEERLTLLEREHDGFRIAEADLRWRGMGDLAGLRQAGVNQEGLDELDLELLLAAREIVADPETCAIFARAGRTRLAP